MSRTDRHRPYRVQEADPQEKRFYWYDTGTPKHGWRKVFTFRACNCRTLHCSGTYWRKMENRRRRHDEKRRARAAVQGDLTAWDRR